MHGGAHVGGALGDFDAGSDVLVVKPTLGAEDFSFYQQKVPGVFFWLGTRPKDQTAEQAASNHSPLFYVDESGLLLGVRAMSHVTVDYLRAGS